MLRVDSTDDDIRDYIIVRGWHRTWRYPTIEIPLGFAISPYQNNIAIVHLDIPGFPITRKCSYTEYPNLL